MNATFYGTVGSDTLQHKKHESYRNWAIATFVAPSSKLWVPWSGVLVIDRYASSGLDRFIISLCLLTAAPVKGQVTTGLVCWNPDFRYGCAYGRHIVILCRYHTKYVCCEGPSGIASERCVLLQNVGIRLRLQGL